MPVNQPIIGEGQADNSWKLELTNQANNEEARVNALVSRIQQLESMVGIAGGAAVTSVDQTGILRLNNGILSNVPASNVGSLQLTNYVQLVLDNQLNYAFTGVDSLLTTTPHQVFVGGQKLIEGVDYNPSTTTNGMITLTRQPDLSNNPTNPMDQLMIELSLWSII